MAVAEQFVGGAAAGGEHRGANGNLDAMRPARRENRLLEGATDTLGIARNVFRGIGAAERDGEFVAGKPRDQRGRAACSLSCSAPHAAPDRHWRDRAYR